MGSFISHIIGVLLIERYIFEILKTEDQKANAQNVMRSYPGDFESRLPPATREKTVTGQARCEHLHVYVPVG
jgi:hypothetical protein